MSDGSTELLAGHYFPDTSSYVHNKVSACQQYSDRKALVHGYS